MTDTRRLTILGLFVTVAGVLHAVEVWVPLPVPVPGAKLGLANIVSLAVIELYGWREALVVAVARVALGALLGGAFSGRRLRWGLAAPWPAPWRWPMSTHAGARLFRWWV
jgi:heptaprenyl diphosphate synthase